MFALIMIPIFALAGAAIDYNHAISVRQKVLIASDAAALAAGQAFNLDVDERKQLAKDFFNANFDNQGSATVNEIDVQIVDQMITVDVDATVPTTILGAIGKDKIDISSKNQVNIATTKLELALVLDTTGSMSGSKISTLKSSVKDLVDTMFGDNETSEYLKFGIVPFASFVKVNPNFASAPWITLDSNDNVACQEYNYLNYWWKQTQCNDLKSNPGNWNGCVRPRNNPNHINDQDAVTGEKITGIYGFCGTEPLLPLINSKTPLKNKIDQLSASGATYIPGGLAWGWRLLSPNEPFTNVVPYENDEWKKALILMTDGENTVNFGYTGDNANDQTAALCTNIKAQGILVFSVAFQISNESTKNLIQSCASDPSYYYDAGDNSGLSEAFGKISEQLSELRISK